MFGREGSNELYIGKLERTGVFGREGRKLWFFPVIFILTVCFSSDLYTIYFIGFCSKFVSRRPKKYLLHFHEWVNCVHFYVLASLLKT